MERVPFLVLMWAWSWAWFTLLNMSVALWALQPLPVFMCLSLPVVPCFLELEIHVYYWGALQGGQGVGAGQVWAHSE